MVNLTRLLGLALLLALIAGPAWGQAAPPAAPVLAADAAAQPGPYCTVSGYTNRGAFTRMSFSLDYGDNAPKPPENQLFIEQQKVEAIHTVPDMLNYLAARGWELVSTVAAPQTGLYFFVMRKRSTP